MITQLPNNAAPIPRLGMIQYNFGTEALHGSKQFQKIIVNFFIQNFRNFCLQFFWIFFFSHGEWVNCVVSDQGDKKCATQFPAPIALAASPAPNGGEFLFFKIFKIHDISNSVNAKIAIPNNKTIKYFKATATVKHLAVYNLEIDVDSKDSTHGQVSLNSFFHII